MKLQFRVFSLFGGSVAMRQRLLLWLLLLGERLLQTHAFPGVVLPMQQLLFIDEFGTLGINQLFPEVLVLQQLQHVQTVGVPVEKRETGKHHCSPITFKPVSTVMNPLESAGYLVSVCDGACWWRNMSTSNILEVLGIFRLLPVQQVLEVVNEGFLSKDASLGQNCIQKPEERYRKSSWPSSMIE